MILLDENISRDQYHRLQSRHVHCRHLGYELTAWGTSDEDIISVLHQLHRCTLFTQDLGFYRHQLAHSSYAIVVVDVERHEVAEYVRRILKHPAFNTQRRRLGKIVKVSSQVISWYQLKSSEEQRTHWQLFSE